MRTDVSRERMYHRGECVKVWVRMGDTDVCFGGEALRLAVVEGGWARVGVCNVFFVSNIVNLSLGAQRVMILRSKQDAGDAGIANGDVEVACRGLRELYSTSHCCTNL
jgi:hypothetical protein